jgi:hypothetical protein
MNGTARAVRSLLRGGWERLGLGRRHRRGQMMRLYRRAPVAADSRGRILLWVPGGMPLMLHMEGAIAAALKLRGFEVHAVICDGPFRACVQRDIRDGIPVAQWNERCAACKRDSGYVLERLGISYSFIGDYVPDSVRATLWERAASVTWQSLISLAYRGVNVGRNAASAVDRYLKGSELNGHEAVVREYAYSALVAAEAAFGAFAALKPSRVYMSHGTYVDWGPALNVAHDRGIPVTAWMASYLKGRFYFRHIEDAAQVDFHNMSERAWQRALAVNLSDAQQARLQTFLDDRYRRHKSFDMKQLSSYSGDVERLRAKYAPQPGKPVWGIVAHINWDAARDYSPMLYGNFDEWILATLREISAIDGVQWLVKIHPAEAWDNPATGVERLIAKHFASLPAHVRIIPATEQISPLDFFELVDGGVTVYGTAGLELALHGRPVILAGDAHYGRKGFTHDAATAQEYCALLRRAASLGSLSAEQLRLARKYAYCYFIRRQIPLSVVQDPRSRWWRFQASKRELLLPGNDAFIDFICERIIDGEDFVMDDRLVERAEAA